MHDTSTLPDVVVDNISNFIKEKLNEQRNAGHIYNALIREDILSLLGQFCVIVYYPTEDSNNGFHKAYTLKDKKIQIVYINTNQAKEKQIFTAAHELGHVWGLDDYLREHVSEIELDDELTEKVMNRFAAELMMPRAEFCTFFNLVLGKVPDTGKVEVFRLIMAVTDTMNEFFVPYKAVIYRLYELGVIKEAGLKHLLDDSEIILKIAEVYAKKQGYDRLFQPDKKRFIDGMTTRLIEAKKNSLLSESWIDAFCRKLDISIDKEEPGLNGIVEVRKGDTNADG